MSQILEAPFRMLSERSNESRAKRYRLEATYLRGLANTISDPREKDELLQIAKAYDRLADRLAR